MWMPRPAINWIYEVCMKGPGVTWTADKFATTIDIINLISPHFLPRQS